MKTKMTGHRMNTIQILYQEPAKKTDFYRRVILLGANLFGATLASSAVIILIYEIPCFIGKSVNLDIPIIRLAVRADHAVTMKYRTNSYAVNKLIHELEEMKLFYSQI